MLLGSLSCKFQFSLYRSFKMKSQLIEVVETAHSEPGFLKQILYGMFMNCTVLGNCAGY